MRVPGAFLLILVWGWGIFPAGQAHAQVPPGKSPATGDTLDIKRIHSEYGDGNFEAVTQILEDFRSRHPQCRSVDSFYVAKYLGVVYAANPATKEKGKYWLYRMLQIDPTADLVDMYVGEDINNTFEKVRQEFIVRRNYKGINDEKLAKSLKAGEPPRKDTVVLKDTVVVKDGWISPITEGISGGIKEVRSGIQTGIKTGYEPVKAEEGVGTRGWTGNINLGGGIKYLDAVDWDALGFSDQTELRVATDFRRVDWPINIAVDAVYAFSPEVVFNLEGSNLGTPGVTVKDYSLNVGVRKIFDFRLYSVRPFFGGGLMYVISDVEFRNGSPDIDGVYRDKKVGTWLSGGVYWEMGRHLNLGLQGLYTWARIRGSAFNGEQNHGGSHLAMILGYHI